MSGLCVIRDCANLAEPAGVLCREHLGKQPPTEMSSLLEIEAKLDALNAKLTRIKSDTFTARKGITALDAALKGTADGLASEMASINHKLLRTEGKLDLVLAQRAKKKRRGAKN